MGCGCKTIKNIVKGVTVSIPKAVISGYATSDVIANRREICDVCPSNKGGICSECSCVIVVKTGFKDVQCPLNKW
jgi:hypothetical protein